MKKWFTTLALAALALLVAVDAHAAGNDLKVTWTNPPPCNPVGSTTPAGCDNATTQDITFATGPGPGNPTNFAPVPGSPFPATTNQVLFTAIPAGTKLTIRWQRKSTIPGDVLEITSTSDMKPGQPGNVLFQWTPNLQTPAPQAPAAPTTPAPSRAPAPKKP
jgi:hypothetical protein